MALSSFFIGLISDNRYISANIVADWQLLIEH